MDRMENLMPDGIPKYIRVYDNGHPRSQAERTADRYFVAFTGRYRHKTGGEYWGVSMSRDPYWPQGVCMSTTHNRPFDRPTSSHLGVRIEFEDLPEDCQRAVREDYAYLWDLHETEAFHQVTT